jgi:hypothetical protein
VHVTWRKNEAKWAVQKEGASRAQSLHDQKGSAEQEGRQAAINEHSELLIHGKDGKIQERSTYKSDRFLQRSRGSETADT